MSFFEIGVDIQHRARTKEWAILMFENSCTKCCITGKHMDCKHCAIAGAHESTIKRLEVVQ